ncbi:TPA: hypothetical protein ACGXMA_002070 [Bacillus cereus]|uniref:Methyltransferase domain protein n=3 Tax=Bacillus cereus TaxID=1396 RepID=A0AAN0W8N1_BACCE|nr:MULTISPECIES: hypothetical protein [Bacillus cereus group]ACO27654.1 conserved hypothetical protein [Bacillus cereus 03BB102]AEW54407.1 Hypothetical protein bcf_06420 [Bacillus cereus F837/76]AJG52406.1 hypothetical protein AS54_1358 [Bacillus cereus 03BB102]AJH67488.1 hypothetical protein BF32_4402 [Bacillus thuringiensis]AJI12896.1 hypothetical protein AK40_5446 [Bacillus cereus 03BB108]
MHSKYIFGPFLRKVKRGNVEISDDIYSDTHFADFYNRSINEKFEINDLDFYREKINNDDVVLEIGSGNGRVFNVLSREGVNIYGIEPQLEMIKYIDTSYKDKIFNIGIEDLDTIKGIKFTKIIIPATTVSLFSEEQFKSFLIKTKDLLDIHGSIIFDFLKPSCIKGNCDKVLNFKTDDSVFFVSNAIIENKYVLNIFMEGNGVKKVGYSVKNLHTIEYFEKVSEELHYKLNILYSGENIYFLELENCEE